MACIARRASTLDNVCQRLPQRHCTSRQFRNYFSHPRHTALMTGSPYFSLDIQSLLWTAIAGNTLGSLTTYALGRWLPTFNTPPQNAKLAWVLAKTQGYGSVMLFFSWLPIVGDLFCAVAGWLRLNWVACLIFMTLGKIVRYVFLLFFGLAIL